MGTWGLALEGDRCKLACRHPFKMFTFEKRMDDFLRKFWFMVHPTSYGPPNHTTKWISIYDQIFSTNHVRNLRNLPLVELLRCKPACWRPFKLFTNKREAKILGPPTRSRPPHSRDVRFGNTYICKPTWKWSNTIIHATGVDIGVFIQSSFFTITTITITLDSVAFNLKQVTFLCLFQSC